jgi:transposase
MSVTPRLPDDPDECQRLAEEARRRIDELQRVLEETAADYSQLQEKHAELAETLALFRRYVFGTRRERHVDDPSQRHLFDLHFIPKWNMWPW